MSEGYSPFGGFMTEQAASNFRSVCCAGVAGTSTNLGGAMRRSWDSRRLALLTAGAAAVAAISLVVATPAVGTPTAAGAGEGVQPRVLPSTHSRTSNPTTDPTATTSETSTAAVTTSAGGTTETSTSGTTVTSPPVDPPAVPNLDWAACRDGFQCAKALAPLDYDRPFGAAVSLSLIRLPAADPTHRIGSLFLNPGGPGGSGVDFVRGVAKSLPLELRARFDLVGFDPRGVGRSTPLRCFATFDEAIAVAPPIAFPVTAEEETLWRDSDLALAAACADRGGVIQDHMSTANAARDMDLLRQAVGDEQLNYLGLSYGSYLGVTYANLFSDRVGALVVDGVLDPVAWSTGTGEQSATVPFSARLGSDAGASSTLGEFFRLCDAAGDDCAFTPNSQARYGALADRLLQEPIEITDPFGTFRFTYADLVALTLGALYAPEVWPDLAGLLTEIEAAASPTQMRQRVTTLARALGAPTAVQEDYPNVLESFPGVACGETDNPLRYQAWPAAAAAADEQHRYFGRPWTWFSSICQPWPGQDPDRYTGPWTAATANPVLVVGNSFDPATPYQGAQKVADLLPNSTLVTYTGWGHTAFASGNYCAVSTIVAYLTTRQTPPDGTVCQPEGTPFGPLAARKAQPANASIQAALIPDIIRRAATHTAR